MGPQINIIGSFFPSWMLCVLIGIVAALLIRLLLVRTGIDPMWGRGLWCIPVRPFSSP
jgi:hypothetical protein